MSSQPKLNNRYEIKEVVGEGGMGIVYRAVDLEVQSDVALKTIKGLLDPQHVELFRKECAVLRKVRHPNIVDLYDFGISEDGGQQKPFFVMPFLPGATLDRLIKSQAARLTPDRVVDIISQTAKGLQAAHDLGLVHRDVKPSNIFVLSDDSVKIIDFGVVHVADQNSRTGFKGTLSYMSPEQLELEPPTAVSDIFSLAVVCYEALTRRRPFIGNNETEIRDSILHFIPPPVFELNPSVSLALSQVIHAAMAKKPWNRTSTVRQFAEELQKALHGHAIERFDPARIEPRILRANRALETSQYDFAAEIVAEIEAEGHIHPTIRSLRRQIDQALRAKAVKQALESAQHRFAENEYQLALQKVDEVLRLDTGNAAALELKSEIDNAQRTQQIENWFLHAQDHLKNYAFNHARKALQNVLRLKPTNSTAIQMLAEVDRRENEYLREHREKEELYKAALEAWQHGEVSVAFGKLERVLELDRRAPDNASSESALSYQNLYEQVRSEHDRINNSYQEARKLLGENDFNNASSLCEQVLTKYPEHTLFQALKEDIGEKHRQYISSYIIKIDRDVEAEPDLDRKVAILTEALRLYPAEAHFQDRLDKVTRRRDLVAGLKQKIDNLEDRGQYAEALGQLEILRAIYPQYPGMDLEIDRISKRRDQQSRLDAKARWLNQIDTAISTGDFAHAVDLLKSALADFPDDAELLAQERLARDGLDRALDATRVFENAQALCAQGEFKRGLDGLWQALQLDQRNPLIQAVLVETLLKCASAELDTDPKTSEQLVIRAIELDPGNRQAVNLQRLIVDRQKDSAVDVILSRSREVQASGDVTSALTVVQQGLGSYPGEQRLIARKEALLKIVPPVKRPDDPQPKEFDLKELYELHDRLQEAQDAATIDRGERSTIAAQIDTAQAPSELSIAPEALVAAPKSKRWMIFSVIPIVIILLGSFAAYRSLRPAAPPAIATPPKVEPVVAVDASVPGARIWVNGSDVGAAPLTWKLPDGAYTIDARLPGYASKPVEFRVGNGAAAPPSALTVTLEPLPSVLRVSTELRQGSLDGERLVLDGTGFEKTDVPQGRHVLQLSSPVAGTVTIEFEMNPAQPPLVHKIDSPRTPIVALAALGEGGQLYSNSKTLKISLNGIETPLAADQSVPVSLMPDQNLFELDDSKNRTTIAVNGESNPGLSVFVGAEPNAGNLEVTETGKVDGIVSIEPADKKGPARTQPLRNGRTTFARLEPKTYLVEVSAPGYETTRMSVAVVRGNIAKAPPVSLKLVPTTATFLITGGTADSDVFVDNGSSPIGKLSSNGEFSYQMNPGKHRIQLRKSDFEDSPGVELEFSAGGTTRLGGPDVVLKPYGWIEFNVTPATSRITYRLNSGTNGTVTSKPGETARVRAGRYSISVAANGFQPYTEEAFDVEPGKGKSFSRTLVPASTTSARAAAAPVVMGKDGIEAPQSQVPYSLFRLQLPGTYSFKIRLRRAGLSLGRRARWVVNYIDRNNYIEYEIDDKNLKYTARLKGKEQSKSVQHQVTAGAGDVFDLTVSVSATEVNISSAGQRIPIETPADAGNLILGKFGFPRDESVDMDSFRFTAAPGR